MAEGKREVTEEQLMQMAQAEDQNLQNKTALIEKLRQVLAETVTAKEVLNELKNAKGKMQVAIGATVLIEVEVSNTKTCKRGFAENGFKEESIEDTKKWLEGKEEKLKAQLQKLQIEAAGSDARLVEMVGLLKQIDTEKKKRIGQKPLTISK